MTTQTPGFTATVSTTEQSTVRIRLTGEFTFETAEELDELVGQALLGHPRLQVLVLDCTDVAAVDSLGLSVLLMVKRRAQQANVRLHLENRPPRLERMLALTGTQTYLTDETGETPRQP